MKMDRITRSDTVKWVQLLCISVLLILGCDAALTVGDRTIGVSSGNFVFTDGYLSASYNFPFDRVWKACEKTLVSVRIGMAGNNMASQLLHEKIANNLLKAADRQKL